MQVKSEQSAPYIVKTNNESDNEIIKQAINILFNRMSAPGEHLGKPEDTINYLHLKLAEKEHEVFCVLFLDNRHRVIAFDELFHGTINGASVHPREVVKQALKHNAAACILAHNHPSGVPEPSQADKRLTDQLKQALALVDVRVLDHIIIASESSVSMAERGLL